MSVFLSPVGGAGAQFFDNNGNPLTGGKLYTYAAGTTTPQATYTSAAGSTFHTNPIILDAAGRVPGSSEIWLADSQIYKFVLKDSNDVLLATWDNITGVNSNFVNYTTETEVQTATAGQTVFTLTTMSYAPGTGSLTVYVDGVNQYEGTSYVETNSTTVTFTAGLHVGALVKFTTAVQTTGNATDASVVSYTGFKGQIGTVQDLADDDGSDWIGFEQAGTGAVARSAQDKMRDVVSVKDFGAVGDGVADDSAAIQAALDASFYVSVPPGNYKITSALVLDDNHVFQGYGNGLSIITQVTVDQYALRATSKTNIQVKNLKVVGTSSGIADGIYFTGCDKCSVEECQVLNFGHNGINFFSSDYCSAVNNYCEGNLISGINVAGTLAQKSTYNKVYGNTLYANSLDTNYGAGILLFGNADYTTVENNVCASNDSFGILVTDSSFNTVTTNMCHNNTYSGIGVHYDNNANASNYITISANICKNNGEHGIVCQSNTSLYDLQIGHAISANQCISNGSSSGKGIYLASGIRNFTVVNNTCEYNAESGIDCAANCARGTITSNVCNNNGAYGTSSASGIRISSTSTEGTFGCYDIVITSNICEDTGPATQQYGVQLDNSTITKITVTANKLTGNVLGEVDDSGTACQVILYPDDGSIIPATDGAQTLGTTVNRFVNVSSYTLTLKDGITAPLAVAGNAFLYVDSSDGDLKVKFGNGTVKTIATNP